MVRPLGGLKHLAMLTMRSLLPLPELLVGMGM